jgi:hypothetical protein
MECPVMEQLETKFIEARRRWDDDQVMQALCEIMSHQVEGHELEGRKEPCPQPIVT